MVSTIGAICHMLEHRNTSAFTLAASSSITEQQLLKLYWCRAPPNNYTLQYVEIIQRHHKRTPYASNTFFKEDIAWSCAGEGPVFAMTRWETFIFIKSLSKKWLVLKYKAWLRRFNCTGRAYLCTCCRKSNPIWQTPWIFTVAGFPRQCESMDNNDWAWVYR